MSIRTTFHLIFAVLLVNVSLLMIVMQWAENNEAEIGDIEKRRSAVFQLVEELWHITHVQSNIAEAYCDTGDSKWRDYYERLSVLREKSVKNNNYLSDSYIEFYINAMMNTRVDPAQLQPPPASLKAMPQITFKPEEQALLDKIREKANQISKLESQAIENVTRRSKPDTDHDNPLSIHNPEYEKHWRALVENIHELLQLLQTSATKEVIQVRYRGEMIHTLGLVLTAISLMCIVGSFYLMYRRIVLPIRHLDRHAARLGQGDYSNRTGYQSQDELGKLAQTIDQMSDAIERDIRILEDNERTIRLARDEIQQSLVAAANIQQSILPKTSPQTRKAAFDWVYEPSDELAGDALFLQQIGDDHVAMYILDASGHGVPASLLAVSISRYLRAADTNLMGIYGEDHRVIPPHEVAARLNQYFPMEDNDNHFFTMIYAVLDLQQAQFRFTAAGHPGPMIVNAQGENRIIDDANPPVGVMNDLIFTETVVDLEPGDTVLLYSDGTFEAEDENHQPFTRERIGNILAQHAGQEPKDQLEQLMNRLRAYIPTDGFDDDVSMIAFRWNGNDGQA